MKLKSNSTYWNQLDDPPDHYPPLQRDATCDVAIIGGGISGALVAHYLVDAGMRALLLDRRDICQGSTSANTGLLQYDPDTSLIELAKRIGESQASAAYRLCEKALHQFPALVEQLRDSCGLVARQSLYLAAKPADAEELQREHAARRACGLEVSYLSQDTLREQYNIDRPAALLSPLAYQVC